MLIHEYIHRLCEIFLGETIDSMLFSVLERNVVTIKGGKFIKFGDGMIDYNANFRLYMTTCLRNPHYLPETSVMVTLLNFMITGNVIDSNIILK